MDSYLSNDCWESIFRFIINDDDHNRNCRYLNSLSLVCKQFLSVANRLRFSYTVRNSTILITSLPISNTAFFRRLFERYTNLNSLNLIDMNRRYSDKLLHQISCFPFKLTSLNLSHIPTFPANGLRAFAQKITTLTSLTCSYIFSLNSSDLFLIAEYFPLLEELDLSYTSCYKNSSSYVDGVEALSLALTKLRKVNLSRFPINDQSLFHLFNNCKHLEEVIVFNCHEITNAALASALRERQTLTSISFSIISSNPEFRQVFTTSHFIDSLVSLKGLTCLVLQFMNISDELLYSIARKGLPLTRLDLQFCINYSYNGIVCLLTKCQRIQYLNLNFANFLNDQDVVQLSSYLGDLVSIYLSNCGQLTKSALVALVSNCPSLSKIKMVRIGSKIVGNSNSSVDFGVYPQLKSLYLGDNSWLSDESIIMFASIFPNLQLLDLKSCNGISEGICQVLKRCSKMRHLNLAGCSKVKLLGLNFVVSELEVLNLTNTMVDDETLYVISKYCCGLSELLLGICYHVTETGLKHVKENCTQLRVLR